MSSSSQDQTTFGIKEITAILPHRYPFLLIDRIVALDLEKSTITGVKSVTINELFFQGHFPEAPIMPGVLILEALAQTGGFLIYKKGFHNKTAVLLSIKQGKFRRPVYPGDQLYLHVEGLYLGAKGGKVRGRAVVNEQQLVAEAEIGFALKSMEQI